MAGAFVGALLVLSLSVLFSWPVTVSSPLSAEEQRARAAFAAPAGSCLTWDKQDSSDLRKVSCRQPHKFELVGTVNLAERFGPDDPLPNAERWHQLTAESCGRPAQQYLKGTLDPYGKFTVNSLRPSTEQWEEGDRKLRCGLQRVTPGGGIQELKGSAIHQNQSDTYPPGTCLGLAGKSVGDPIDCGKAHAYEIIGTVDLGQEFTEGFPKKEDQRSYLDKECSKIADSYTGGKDLDKLGLIVSWDLREEESWSAGSRLVNCKIAAEPKSESALAPVTGSVRKQPEPSDEKSSGKKSEQNTDSDDSGSGGGQNSEDGN